MEQSPLEFIFFLLIGFAVMLVLAMLYVYNKHRKIKRLTDPRKDHFKHRG